MTDTLSQIVNTPVGAAASGVAAVPVIDLPNTGHALIDTVLKVVVVVVGLIPSIKQLFGRKKRKQNSEPVK